MSTNSVDNIRERYNASRNKTAFAERDLYLKPLLRLKQQEDVIERGLTAAIESMKLDSSLLRDIVHERKEISKKRQNFLSTMYKNMEEIASEMEWVKCIAKEPNEIRKIDVNTYKTRLIKLSQKMQDLEKSCCMQSLLEEHAVLDAELREFEPYSQKNEKTQKNAGSFTSSSHNRTENKKEKQDYKDVHDFHALVAVTGHTENWTMEDHLFFLKMRKKCGTVPALVAAIQKKCPDLSVETIVNHESWYKHYQNLREKQKEAVKEWREQKEQQKMKNIEEVEKNIELHELEDIPSKNNEEKRTIIPRKIKTSHAETRRTSNSADSNAVEKKEMIRKWKIEKENKRSMDEEQLKTQMRLKREMEENKRRKRRQKIQQALEEYKREKFLKNTLKESNEHSTDGCKYDSTLIKAFRKQDEEYTKKRKDLIQRSRKPSKSETIGIKKLELVDARNYSTLLNSTKVWRERCKVESSTNRFNEVRYIKDVPRTCVRWRNEESGDLNILRETYRLKNM